jgi:hypothetical protein
MTKGRAKKPAGQVYFPDGLYDIIMSLPEPHEGPLFMMPVAKRRMSTLAIEDLMRKAIRRAGLTFKTPVTPYALRHIYAERTKDKIPAIRLAAIMRTSVTHLERTYGKHSDDSFLSVVQEAHAQTWGVDHLRNALKEQTP